MRMWIVQLDEEGKLTDEQLSVDDPLHIPRKGDIVDGFEPSGTVQHVHWRFGLDGKLGTVYVFVMGES